MEGALEERFPISKPLGRDQICGRRRWGKGENGLHRKKIKKKLRGAKAFRRTGLNTLRNSENPNQPGSFCMIGPFHPRKGAGSKHNRLTL